MTPKSPLRAFDGTSYSDVRVLNVPAGAIDANGEIDLGQGIKVYRALLTQSGTDAPVATVLENTLGGTVVWTYSDTGIYTATLVGAFTASKTCLPPVNASKTLEALTEFVETSFFRLDDDSLRLQSAIVDVGVNTQTLSNSLLANAYVKIEVNP